MYLIKIFNVQKLKKNSITKETFNNECLLMFRMYNIEKVEREKNKILQRHKYTMTKQKNI